MTQYNIYRKQNLYTTAGGVEVQVMEFIDFTDSISAAADKISVLIKEKPQFFYGNDDFVIAEQDI